MSFTAKILHDARLDIIETIAWYNEQQVGLGKRFRTALTETISRIRDNPMLSAVQYRNVRMAYINKFPHLVYYIFEEQRQGIIVLAILHGSRNPAIWKGRAG